MCQTRRPPFGAKGKGVERARREEFISRQRSLPQPFPFARFPPVPFPLPPPPSLPVVLSPTDSRRKRRPRLRESASRLDSGLPRLGSTSLSPTFIKSRSQCTPPRSAVARGRKPVSHSHEMSHLRRHYIPMTESFGWSMHFASTILSKCYKDRGNIYVQ